MIGKLPTSKIWEKIGATHHHGILIPLLSIWTEKSSGNGEFLDLIPLIDWISSLGMDVLQLLPLNDTGEDPSPYNALSSTALHPIYLSLHALPGTQDLKRFKSFCSSKRIDYGSVLSEKLLFLRAYIKTHGEKIFNDPAYSSFTEKSPHLKDDALFKALLKKNGDKIWIKWPDEEKHLTKTHRKVLEKELSSEIQFHLAVQFLCHMQLLQVKAHAEKKNVFLKGDIPILVSRNSADVYTHREFFNDAYTVGSPPNAFDPPGQNWHFPLYNWSAMEHNHFEWWKNRIQVAANYFHIYRVDHILGFFRVWAVPFGKTPADSHFEPSDQGLMEAQGKKLLSALISFSDMLPNGEDLGKPPPFVRQTMQELGIPGIKIFRRNRRWDTDKSFIPFEEFPPLSISSISTHDLEPISLWWKNFPDEAKDFAAFKKWEYEKDLSKHHLFEILQDNHHSGSLFHVDLLQEFLALIPELTWENLEDEQINIPGTCNPFNWTYRYKHSVEKIASHSKLKELMKQCIQK